MVNGRRNFILKDIENYKHKQAKISNMLSVKAFEEFEKNMAEVAHITNNVCNKEGYYYHDNGIELEGVSTYSEI